MPSGQYNVVELSSTSSITAASASTAATITTVIGSTTSGSVLAANTSRKGVLIQNDAGSGFAYVAYAVTASTAAYSIAVPLNAYWEMPPPVFQGQLSVISTSCSTLRVTEF